MTLGCSNIDGEEVGDADEGLEGYLVGGLLEDSILGAALGVIDVEAVVGLPLVELDGAAVGRTAARLGVALGEVSAVSSDTGAWKGRFVTSTDEASEGAIVCNTIGVPDSGFSENTKLGAAEGLKEGA